jgi:electron transport complex protein RnfD
MEQKTPLTLSFGPHIHYPLSRSTASLMWTVNLALMPALIWAVLIFGWPALAVTLSAVLGTVLGEFAMCALTRTRVTLRDGSAVCSGILLAFVIAPGMPLFMPFVGGFLGIVLAKGVFGGLGYNIFNVALIARAIMMATFPVPMTTAWLVPRLGGFVPDGVTMATPMAVLKARGLDAALALFNQMPDSALGALAPWEKLMLGLRPGSIGEVSVLFIVLGSTFLVYKRIIKLYIPLSVIAGTALMGCFSASPMIHSLAGGLWLGAFFMATDYVTSPITPRGQIVFGLGIGVITGVIRIWGGYPEGICYAILLMNILVPALNEWFPPRHFASRFEDVAA